MSPKPQDGYVVKRVDQSPNCEAPSCVEYWCMAWQTPYVKGVAFSMRLQGGSTLVAQGTDARYYRWDRPGDRPDKLAMARLINLPNLPSAKIACLICPHVCWNWNWNASSLCDPGSTLNL